MSQLSIHFYGHATFALTHNEHNVLIDPFFTDNPATQIKPADVKTDAILITHAHFDHFGPDALTIAKNNNATIYAPMELAAYCADQGYQTVPINAGGALQTDWGKITFTPAVHSSSYQGQYMGDAVGIVVEITGVRFFDAGDTALFSDIQLIGQRLKPDIVALPIGDQFTMGPADATLAAEWLAPKYAIPMHYGTWPQLVPNADGFTPKGCEILPMQAGETFDYPID